MNNKLITDGTTAKYIPNIFIAGIISFAFIIVGGLFASVSMFFKLPDYLSMAIFDLMIGFGMATIICFGYVKLVEKRKIKTLGFYASRFKGYFLGFLIAILMFSGIVAVANLLGGMRTSLNGGGFKTQAILIILLGFIIQGGTEEVVFRGWLMPIIGSRYNLKLSIIVTSALFALLHGMNPGITVLPIINLILFGIFAALYALVEESLWGICGFHGAWNWVQGSFYGVKVSGAGVPGGSFFKSISTDGKELISGGLFGIEGSILCTVALIIGIVYLGYRLRRKGDL